MLSASRFESSIACVTDAVRRQRHVIVCLAIAAGAVSGAGAAGVASSSDYSLDYSAVGSGGADAQSGDYSVVSLVTNEGVGAGNSSSSDYSTAPLIGTDAVTTPVTISGFSVE